MNFVIYHSADYDGLFCREIARQFMPDATLVGWNYGDPLPAIPEGVQLYMLDISVDGLMDYPGLIWIDHHKSAIEKFTGEIKGYRVDGVAACRLAWQWFAHPQHYSYPGKADYVSRSVSEPLSVRLAGEYDIWDKRDPSAELFQHGLRSMDLTDSVWERLLNEQVPEMVNQLLENGRSLQYAQEHQNASIIRAIGFTVQFEGLTFLACNHARYNSHLFTAGIKPEHDALLGFNWDGKGLWRVSLYHAPGREHHDLSLIAVKHGGGGHRGACGFKTNELPFLT